MRKNQDRGNQDWRNLRRAVRVRVSDVFGPEPALTGEGNPKVKKVEMSGLVCVGVDEAENPQVAGLVPPAPIEIQTPRMSIEFNPGSGGDNGIEELRNIQGVGFAVEKDSSGGMAQAGDVFVLHGPDDAVGHLFFVRSESGVD